MTKEPRPHPRGFGGSLYDKMVAKVDRAYADWKSTVADGFGPNDPRVKHMYGRLEGACSLLGIFRGNDTKTQIALAKERYDAR